MRLGIDIDQTIVNTVEVALAYGKKYRKHLNLKIEEDLYTGEGFKFYTKYLVEILKSVSLFPGVNKALNILKENGFELIFITARGSQCEFDFTYNHEEITKEIFKKYNVPHDKIIYKCYPKGEVAFKEEIDYFIDDKEDNLDDIAKYGIKCLKKVEDMADVSKHLKFTNWDDILKYLLEEAL
ncbi:MAG: hypothetical protein PHX04_02635 [Bacilli bacterium]|nr:hypothetical protein [Bacilli bacterium]